MGGRDDYEIIFVNDASTDHTLERSISASAAPTSAVQGAATATHVMMLPGDDGFPRQSIAEIMSHAGEADIIV
jgi:hypothetical protein